MAGQTGQIGLTTEGALGLLGNQAPGQGSIYDIIAQILGPDAAALLGNMDLNVQPGYDWASLAVNTALQKYITDTTNDIARGNTEVQRLQVEASKAATAAQLADSKGARHDAAQARALQAQLERERMALEERIANMQNALGQAQLKLQEREYQAGLEANPVNTVEAELFKRSGQQPTAQPTAGLPTPTTPAMPTVPTAPQLPTAAKGKTVPGPDLIQVGEKGKWEYLYGQPGTVVAPHAKGEKKPTREGGWRAIMAQIGGAQEGTTVEPTPQERWQAAQSKRLPKKAGEPSYAYRNRARTAYPIQQSYQRQLEGTAPAVDMEAKRRQMVNAAITKALYQPKIAAPGTSAPRRAAYMGQRNQPAPTKATLARSRPTATEPNMGFRTDLSDWENINFRNWLERQLATPGRPQAQTGWLNAQLGNLGPRPIYAAQFGTKVGGSRDPWGLSGIFENVTGERASAQAESDKAFQDMLAAIVGGKQALYSPQLGGTGVFGAEVPSPNDISRARWNAMDPEQQAILQSFVTAGINMNPNKPNERTAIYFPDWYQQMMRSWIPTLSNTGAVTYAY